MDQPVTNPPVPINLVDVFNLVKISAVHEMAKADNVLRSPHTGVAGDVEKIAAQGAYSVAEGLFKLLTDKLQKVQNGTFSILQETNELIENISKLDKYSLLKIQMVTPQNAAPAPAAPVPAEEMPAGESIQ